MAKPIGVICFPICFVLKDKQELNKFKHIMVTQCDAEIMCTESGHVQFAFKDVCIHAVCQDIFIEMQISHRWGMVYIQDEIDDYSKIYDLAEATISGPQFGDIICGWNGPAFFKIDDGWRVIR